MKLYIRRKLIAVPLIIAGLLIISGVLNAEAARLKDIRIGEYKGFTRIVFEMNAHGTPPHIQPQSNGVLTIGFDGGRPDLNRKIPVERSEHVRALKLWHRDNRLSIILQFDFDHFRFETFPLEKPPRIALDIHPLTAKPVVEEAKTSQVDNGAGATPEAPPEHPPSNITESADLSRKPEPHESNLSRAADPSNQHRANGLDHTEPGLQQAVQDKVPPMPTLVTEPPAKKASDMDRSQPRSNRMQFYLVVTLVVITMVILALLLLMLLARHRWTGDKDESNVNEYLKSQDQRIASLNARIQEQFKRYEEA